MTPLLSAAWTIFAAVALGWLTCLLLPARTPRKRTAILGFGWTVFSLLMVLLFCTCLEFFP